MSEDNNHQYELGRLSAESMNLASDIREIKNEIHEIKAALEDLKIWKGQVIAVSWVSSFVASGVFYALGAAVKHIWP